MIKKREYNKAMKIVKEYEKQMFNKSMVMDKAFGFLWWDKNGTEHHTWIKAKNINNASRKFIRNQPKTIEILDYEVQNGNKYIDISDRKEFQHWI